MLTTETYVLDGAIEEIEDRITTLEETLEDLEQGTDEYGTVKSRLDRLRYLRNGLEWQRDEEDWPADAAIELGAMTAGEEAMMHREAPDSAEPKEMRLWYVAASTVDAPYGGDDQDLEETFSALAGCHPAFLEWAEAKVNGLGVPGGNGSSTSSIETATEASATSSDETSSTTTSSSDSPTA